MQGLRAKAEAVKVGSGTGLAGTTDEGDEGAALKGLVRRNRGAVRHVVQRRRCRLER